jgi:hypothetical protein
LDNWRSGDKLGINGVNETWKSCFSNRNDLLAIFRLTVTSDGGGQGNLHRNAIIRTWTMRLNTRTL